MGLSFVILLEKYPTSVEQLYKNMDAAWLSKGTGEIWFNPASFGDSWTIQCCIVSMVWEVMLTPLLTQENGNQTSYRQKLKQVKNPKSPKPGFYP